MKPVCWLETNIPAAVIRDVGMALGYRSWRFFFDLLFTIFHGGFAYFLGSFPSFRLFWVLQFSMRRLFSFINAILRVIRHHSWNTALIDSCSLTGIVIAFSFFHLFGISSFHVIDQEIARDWDSLIK